MKRLIIVMALAFSSFVLLPIQNAQAVSPDRVDQLIQQCEDAGGVWLGDEGRCRPPEESAEEANEFLGTCNPDASILGIPTWYKYLEGEVVSGKCRPIIDTEAGDAVSVGRLLPIGLAILEAMMVLGGLVAVVMIFVGAFKYIISQGEPEKAKGAQKTVINAAVGLVIIIAATWVVSFVGNRIG